MSYFIFLTLLFNSNYALCVTNTILKSEIHLGFSNNSRDHHEKTVISTEEKSCPLLTEQSKTIHGVFTAPFFNADYFIHLKMSMKGGGTATCSGVLYKPGLVLTDANCVKNARDWGWYVYGGIQDYWNVEAGQKRIVEEFQIPFLYFKNLQGFEAWDLAIISVEKFDLIPGRIGTVRLPTEEENNLKLSQWKVCQIAESGRTAVNSMEKCEHNYVRRYNNGKIIKASCCNQTIQLENHAIYSNDSACFRNKNSYISCSDYSGAGVICKSPLSGELVLFGLIRGGPKCCDKYMNTVYKRRQDERSILRFNAPLMKWINTIEEFYEFNNELPQALLILNQTTPVESVMDPYL